MLDQVTHGRFGGLAAGSHDDDHALSVRCTDVVEEVIRAAGQFSKLVHILLDDGGNGRVIGVDGLARLEEHVRVLGRAAQDWMVGRQRPSAVGAHQFVIDHRSEVVIAQLFDLVDFMGGAETIEEMQERHPGL